MDEFDTVAVTYSQPEAAVMLSFLGWHGIHAYALSEHARVNAALVTALGGIPIRVVRADVADARALLAEVAAAAPPVVRPPVSRHRVLDVAITLGTFFLGAVLPPRVRSD